MTENELIGKIRELKQIRPRQDWVVLTKERILGSYEVEPRKVWFFERRLALATALSLLILIGIFGFAQNTVPGDFLYSIKKMGEITKISFAPAEEQPKIHLELANKRLEDLNQIAVANRVKNLAPAVSEFQASISEAVKGLKATSSDPGVLKEIVKETQKLKKNKEKIEALGIVVGNGEIRELDNTLQGLVEREIEDLESRTLSEEQLEILKEAQEFYKAGDYSQALEKILQI